MLSAMDGRRDRDLMRRYGKGDARAFEVLYERHKGPLYRYLARRCTQRETAEEIFQEVWTRVIKARTTYRPEAKFTTWLYQLAHNCYVDFVRHSARRIQLVGGADDTVAGHPDEGRSAGERLDGQRAAHEFARALEMLPPDQKDAFLLHEEGGLTLAQIAEVTGVNRETVKSRLRYALRKLRAALSDAQDNYAGSST